MNSHMTNLVQYIHFIWSVVGIASPFLSVWLFLSLSVDKLSSANAKFPTSVDVGGAQSSPINKMNGKFEKGRMLFAYVEFTCVQSYILFHKCEVSTTEKVVKLKNEPTRRYKAKRRSDLKKVRREANRIKVKPSEANQSDQLALFISLVLNQVAR